MDTNAAIRALRSAGHEVAVRDSRHVEVDGRSYRHYTLRKSATRRDAENALAASGDALFTPDTLTPSLRDMALGNEHAIVVTSEAIIIDRRLIATDDPDTSPPAEGAKGRKPYARFAVGRALLATTQPLSQAQLASLAGVTQGGVAKALLAPEFTDVVIRGRGAIVATNRGELFDRIRSGYPGPGGITTYWWKDSAPTAQAKDILSADPLSRISGDVAADWIAPWRKPEHAVAYSQAAIDPRRLGYAMAGPEDYTLMLIHADDSTITATAKAWLAPDVVDPVIIAYDVERTGATGDQQEAVELLRKYAIGG